MNISHEFNQIMFMILKPLLQSYAKIAYVIFHLKH